MPLLGSLAAGSVKGFGAQANLGYFLGQSLRFRSSASAYLSRTPTTAGNQKTWTWSGWIKRGNVSSSQFIFEAGTTANETNRIYIDSSGRLNFQTIVSSVEISSLITTALYRDPSAWYHIIFAVDTTQATSSNRVKIYVNGSQVTAFNTATYQSQNSNTYVNSTIAHTIGRRAFTNASPFDGYMGDVYFIDGQALTPSDFGKTDPSTGSWIPKKYSGTYGTNGFKLDFKDESSTTYAYEFSGSNALTSSSSGYAFGTGDFTVEFWFKVDSLANYRSIIDTRSTGNDAGGIAIASSADGNIYNYSGAYIVQAGAGATVAGQWYHLAYTRESGTHKLWLDGVLVDTDTTARNYTSTALKIGRAGYGGETFAGDISNIRIVKGTAVYTSNFTPSITNLEDITNTTLLTALSSSIEDTSSSSQTLTNESSVTVGANYKVFSRTSVTSDRSGNENNYPSTNTNLIGTTDTTYDLMNDVPTLTSEDKSNFAVLNPLNKASNLTLTEANLKATGASSAYNNVYSTFMIPKDVKTYFEVTVVNSLGGGNNLAFYLDSVIDLSRVGAPSGAYGIDFGVTSTYYTYLNGTSTNTGVSISNGHTVQMAIDQASGKMWIGINNTWLSSGNPSTGDNSIATISTTTDYFIRALCYSSGSMAFNFGQRPFKYTPPTGYKKLNTYNL